MINFLLLTLLLIIVNLGVKWWKYIKIPSVVTMIILWISINISLIYNFFITDSNLHILKILWNIGVIALMFLAWLGSSIKKLKKDSKESLIISIIAFFTTLILVFCTLKIGWIATNIAIIVAVCLSISAEWTTTEILYELKKLNTNIGAILMETWIIDDILGTLFFIAIVLIFHINNISEILVVIISVLAFFVGVIIKKHLWKKEKLISKIENRTNLIIIPFFFINIWLNFDANFSNINYGLLISLLIVCMIGKIVGTLLTKKFVNIKTKELLFIWDWLNSRWAIGLAIAYIVFEIGILPNNIYSILIMISLLTTLQFPFMARIFNKKIKWN